MGQGTVPRPTPLPDRQPAKASLTNQARPFFPVSGKKGRFLFSLRPCAAKAPVPLVGGDALIAPPAQVGFAGRSGDRPLHRSRSLYSSFLIKKLPYRAVREFSRVGQGTVPCPPRLPDRQPAKASLTNQARPFFSIPEKKGRFQFSSASAQKRLPLARGSCRPQGRLMRSYSAFIEQGGSFQWHMETSSGASRHLPRARGRLSRRRNVLS